MTYTLCTGVVGMYFTNNLCFVTEVSITLGESFSLFPVTADTVTDFCS